jgi:hypothetical protein
VVFLIVEEEVDAVGVPFGSIDMKRIERFITLMELPLELCLPSREKCVVA